MTETLEDLWQSWAEESARGPLALAFLVLITVWILSVAVTFFVTRRAWRSQASATPWVLAVPLAFAAGGILQPRSFHWWTLVGLAIAPILAFLNWLTLRQTVAHCPRSHHVVPSWPFCPWCPSPLAAFGGSPATFNEPPAARGIATILRRPVPPEPTASVEAGAGHTEMLVCLVPDREGTGEVVIQPPGATVGRNPDALVWLDDPTVSWEHARIVSRDGAPAVVDLASSNGTYVNDERVETSLLLADDRVQFGGVLFRVRRT